MSQSTYDALAAAHDPIFPIDVSEATRPRLLLRNSITGEIMTTETNRLNAHHRPPPPNNDDFGPDRKPTAAPAPKLSTRNLLLNARKGINLVPDEYTHETKSVMRWIMFDDGIRFIAKKCRSYNEFIRVMHGFNALADTPQPDNVRLTDLLVDKKVLDDLIVELHRL